jgi:hypothetical protein
LPADVDGDGWAPADGDCCETPADGCTVPALVNPGAFDFAGDGVDDDCNAAVDDGEATCDQALTTNANDPADYAKALDLCAQTVENAALAERSYGLIEAQLSLTDGTGVPATASRAIRAVFGGVTVQRGVAMTVLSTGNAATPGQINPSFSPFETGTDAGTTSSAPGDWLDVNGDTFPTVPGCPAASSTAVNDAVMLNLRVRVPTNAQSLRLSMNFLSAEFPEWVCSPFFDLFVALLDSGATTNPIDKNIASFELTGGATVPVSVNLASGNTGLFTQCRNGAIGCGGTAGTINTCTGTGELVGSGFDQASAGCQMNDDVGGGTGWLTIHGNVVPGEIAELRLAIWDTSDHNYDSLVILDDLRWSRDPAP